MYLSDAQQLIAFGWFVLMAIIMAYRAYKEGYAQGHAEGKAGMRFDDTVV